MIIQEVNEFAPYIYGSPYNITVKEVNELHSVHFVFYIYHYSDTGIYIQCQNQTKSQRYIPSGSFNFVQKDVLIINVLHFALYYYLAFLVKSSASSESRSLRKV